MKKVFLMASLTLGVLTSVHNATAGGADENERPVMGQSTTVKGAIDVYNLSKSPKKEAKKGTGFKPIPGFVGL